MPADPYPTPMHGTPAATTDGEKFLAAIRRPPAAPAGFDAKLGEVRRHVAEADRRTLAVATEVLAALVSHQGTPCGNPGNPGHWQRWAAFAADAAEALVSEFERRAKQ